MSSIFSFLFPILLLAMGVYVLYSAIRSKGKLFSMENIKDDSKDQAKKIMRGMYFGLAAIMLLMALSNTLSTVLYSNRVTYFKLTDAYTETFPDLISENGKLYKVDINQSTNQGTFALDNGVKVEMPDADQNSLLAWYDPQYRTDNVKMDQNICYAFMRSAYAIHMNETNIFPQTQSSMLSCVGASVDFSKFYGATDLLDDSNEPIYTESEKANGHVAYYTLFSHTRSDAKEDSFAVKLYHTFSETLLRILNYVLLGLAVIVVVALFVVIRKFTDKEKLQKAREQQVRPAMPADAFNFDDEQPKQNALKEDK